MWVIYFSKNLAALSAIDDWVGTFLIVVLAAIQVICFGWVFGMDRGMKEAHEGAQMRIPGFVRFIIKYVAPLYLIIAIVMFSKDNLGVWVQRAIDNPVERNTLIMIGLVVVFLAVLTHVGTKRWRAAGLDVDGERPPQD